LKQGRFSEIIQLNIVIQKPWWQNNWFRLAILLFVIAVIALLYNRRVNQIREKEKLKTRQNAHIKELEQTALRSQMNPHFIFNCLTSIQQLIISGNTTDANEHLVKFARLIRKTLELSAHSTIKVSEERDYLDEYLFLEQLRIPGQFDYKIEIDDAIDVSKTEIPNMMVQPIVENCIRHGIKHLENKKGLILVSIQKKNETILCIVTDNGTGRKPSIDNKSLFSAQKSYGLEIVRKRLELLSETNEGDFSIEIEDLKSPDGSPAGTKITIQIPYKITSHD
jgi:LytS/YehU family sensor histidine kinase